ncbi:MAG: hypothetical protein PHX83_12170 [Acidobacteriia bacterium]|nr:hypothetical protein [Terriglobia bacterium]
MTDKPLTLDEVNRDLAKAHEAVNLAGPRVARALQAKHEAKRRLELARAKKLEDARLDSEKYPSDKTRWAFAIVQTEQDSIALSAAELEYAVAKDELQRLNDWREDLYQQGYNLRTQMRAGL